VGRFFETDAIVINVLPGVIKRHQLSVPRVHHNTVARTEAVLLLSLDQTFSAGIKTQEHVSH